MIESGIYGFFTYDWKTGTFILTTGRAENKTRREKDYRITNANIEFDFWSPVEKKHLVREEKKIQKLLFNSGFKYWKNSIEQFEIGRTKDDLIRVENVLSECFYKLNSYRKNFQSIQYEIGVLFDENGNLGGEVDVRKLRKKCDFIPGEEAMIVNKAGYKEKTRKYLTKYKKEGRRLVELEQPVYVNVSNKAWDIIQIVQNNERNGKENII